MSVDQLSESVLRIIWQRFYAPRSREFHRDKIALLKAIMRFGYECNQRGWFLETEFVASEILKVLESAAKHKASIEYLPAYLDAAIAKAIGQRAEELSAKAKSLNNLLSGIVKNIKVADGCKYRKDIETMSAVFLNLNKRSKQPKRATPQQRELL